jgi:pimeloyl-ACP methyl ester carboxylesterase
MQKKIYIIPGFGENKKDKPYLELIKFFESKNFEVIFYEPKWSRNTIEKWLNDFEEVLKNDTADNSMVFGFSFGALIAVLSTKTHKFSKLILCSLSPYFSDNIKLLPALAEKYLGKRRMIAFEKQDFPKDIKIPVIFLVGSKEKELFPNDSKKYYDLWQGSKKFILVSDAEHDISNQNYISAIKSLFI